MAASKSSRTRTPAGRRSAPVQASPTSPSASASGASSTSGGSSTRTLAGAGRADASRSAGRASVASQPKTTPLAPIWLQWTTFVLAIVGLADSIYLTYEHFTGNSTLACSDKGFINCGAVTTSAESWVWPIPGHWKIPVAVLGLAFFTLAMVPLMSPWGWRITDHVGRFRVAPTLIPWVRLGSLIIGMIFVLYLLYSELVKIKSICLYCTGVHIITFLLFVLTVFAAALYGLNPLRTDED
jgi:uncharacterized membrane protein